MAEAKNKKRINWLALEGEFVCREGDEISLNDFAKDHGVDPGRLRAKAGKAKWLDKRGQFQRRVAAEVEKIRTKDEVSRRVKMLKLTDAMKGVAQTSLTRLIKELQADETKRLNTGEIRLMLKDATEMERAALGLPDVIAMTDEELNAKITRLADELSARASSEDS